MTVPDGGPHVNGGRPNESSILSPDDGDIHVCQDGAVAACRAVPGARADR
jgi:hypothetical protein